MIRNEPEQPPRGPLIILKTILLILSMLLGIIGIFFFTYCTNFRASSACLQLVLTCALYLHPTCTILKGKLHETYSLRRFKLIFILAIIIGFIELVASIGCITLAVLTEEVFNFGVGFYVCAIPISLCCLWAFLLTHECRLYIREFGIIEAAAGTSTTQVL